MDTRSLHSISLFRCTPSTSSARSIQSCSVSNLHCPMVVGASIRGLPDLLPSPYRRTLPPRFLCSPFSLPLPTSICTVFLSSMFVVNVSLVSASFLVVCNLLGADRFFHFIPVPTSKPRLRIQVYSTSIGQSYCPLHVTSVFFRFSIVPAQPSNQNFSIRGRILTSFPSQNCRL